METLRVIFTFYLWWLGSIPTFDVKVFTSTALCPWDTPISLVYHKGFIASLRVAHVDQLPRYP